MKSLVSKLLVMTSLVMTSGVLLAAPAQANAERNFSVWEPRVAAYERMDRTNPPPKGAVLFVGSSTIEYWTNLSQAFPNNKVINRGIGGTHIADVTHFADRLVFPYEPKMIVLFSALNDIHDGITPERTFEDLKEFVALVRTRLPKVEIALISLNPRISRRLEKDKQEAFNEMARNWARKTGQIKYIDTWTITLTPDGQLRPDVFVADSLHLNGLGYQLLAERVRPFMPKK